MKNSKSDASHVSIATCYIGDYRTPHLAIEHTLLGKAHRFTYKDVKAEITLPDGDLKEIKSRLPWEETNQPTSLREQSASRPGIYYIGIEQVTLKLEVEGHLYIPQGMLTQAPNAYSLLNGSELKMLEDLGFSKKREADNLFRHWLATMRIKSMNPIIGRSLRDDKLTLGSSRIMSEENNNKTIWLTGVLHQVYIDNPITEETWKEVQVALNSQEIVPLYYEYLFDGIVHKREGDLKRAVIDFAVSAEIFIKEKISAALSSLPNSIARYIDRAPITQITSRFFPDILSKTGKSEFTNISNELSELFQTRNELLHSGVSDNLTLTKVDVLKGAVEGLIELGKVSENWICISIKLLE